MPAGSAARLLDGDASGALARARDLPIDELLELIEKRTPPRPRRRRFPVCRGKFAPCAATPTASRLPRSRTPTTPNRQVRSRALLTRNANSSRGVAIAARAIGATQAYLYLHPEAIEERAAAERALAQDLEVEHRDRARTRRVHGR